MSGVVLDITRSLSRVVNSRITGIDRVELAYIAHFLTVPEPVAFLARFSNRCAVLDRAAMRTLLERIQSHGPWRKARFWRRNKKADIEATVQWLAVPERKLHAALGMVVPDGFTYLNVGHSGPRPQVWTDLRRAGVGKIAVLVHDLIPLDYPQYCRVNVGPGFEKRMQAFVQNADILLCNSTDTADRLQGWAARWGYPDVRPHVVFLGTDRLPVPVAQTPPEHPYFVTLGTIEPRKNHRLLLDIWQAFSQTLPADQIPHLYIVGARGWMNEDVFETLDTAGFMNKTVFETGRLPDAEVAQLVQGAQALLFPSFVEGFGYPLVEALQLGSPVICSDLPSFHELAGETPTYINPKDILLWRESIKLATTNRGELPDINEKFPNWEEHFHILATIFLQE